jgi:hypothetical protein
MAAADPAPNAGPIARSAAGLSQVLVGDLHRRIPKPAATAGQTREGAAMNLTTILIILVVLAVLGGGWGMSRRGRY